MTSHFHAIDPRILTPSDIELLQSLFDEEIKARRIAYDCPEAADLAARLIELYQREQGEHTRNAQTCSLGRIGFHAQLGRPSARVALRRRHEHDRHPSRSTARAAEATGEHRQRKVAAARRDQRQHVEVIGPGALANGLHSLTVSKRAPRFELPSQAESFANCLDHQDQIM
jgi:hypothetical protein